MCSCALCVGSRLDAGMAADPLPQVAVKLQGTERSALLSEGCNSGSSGFQDMQNQHAAKKARCRMSQVWT